jgi:translation initiation factor 4E
MDYININNNNMSVHKKDTHINKCIQLNEPHKPHKLNDNWVLWAHLPHNTNWSLQSYKEILTISSVEDVVGVYKVIPDKLIKNCMLFHMRKGITPTWEDIQNRTGGSFSYKVLPSNISTIWKNISYMLSGETLATTKNVSKKINGITISPKRTFYIIKIWMKDCSVRNAKYISTVSGLNNRGCLFKKHNPEY